MTTTNNPDHPDSLVNTPQPAVDAVEEVLADFGHDVSGDCAVHVANAVLKARGTPAAGGPTREPERCPTHGRAYCSCPDAVSPPAPAPTIRGIESLTPDPNARFVPDAERGIIGAPAGGDQTPGLREVFTVNHARCVSPDGFNHPLDSWSIAEWTNAIAGEAGEACNIAKKLIRFRDNVRGNVKPGDQDEAELKQRLAYELADVVIYADLAARALGFDIEVVVVEAFNRKSEELGLPYLAEAPRG